MGLDSSDSRGGSGRRNGRRTASNGEGSGGTTVRD